ncbi:GNAT family N-acetyltransferase [Leptothermofonsia sichuanensis E412]|uniref:GNAT family N-acetyltransferase n=1 Tax=Leptothermofonsia sichuanensis TaxID=2917832 RepID=UPI001CA69B10|nr:GNAT family N-acetyltransferase [Leptothermofonsia sichuanensis]QZZ19257.1 GNAT family N-acetyltransferase [Leptothermofonsia sichuanensis E412]
MAEFPKFTVRSAQDSDLTQVVNLDRLSFAPLSSDEEIKQEWFADGISLPGRKFFLAIETETGEGVGGYAQLDLRIWFEQQAFPAMGIAAVAVAPHRRGQRIARLMLEHALTMGQEQNLPLIALYPFQHGFYRKLGWAWVEQMHQYRVSARYIPGFRERSQIFPYHPDHQSSLQSVYDQAASHHNGWFQRQSWQWESRLKPAKGREIYCYGHGTELTGYVILQFTHLPSQVALSVVVQEWVALSAEAYRGILGFLASLRDQVSTIVWNTYPADPFPHLLQEQRQDPGLASTSFEFGLVHPFGAIGGGFMWRLVDLKQAFALRPIRSGESFALTFQVTDPVLGNRAIAAEFSNQRMTSLKQPTSTVIYTSIAHLTELFCGVRRATDLLWTGEIEYEGELTLLSQLDRAWQAEPPFCWDFF